MKPPEPDDARSEARAHRLFAIVLAYGVVTLALLWLFARSYAV